MKTRSFGLGIVWSILSLLTPMFAEGDAGGSGSGTGAGTGGGAGSGGSGSSGGGNGTPTVQSGAQGGSPPSAGSGGAPSVGSPAPGQASAVDWKTAPQQFREAYETLKGNADRFTGLGEYDAVSNFVEVGKAMLGEVFQTGKALGYSNEQISTALEKDAFGTLFLLRQKAAERGIASGNGTGGQGQGNGQPGQGQDVRDLIRQEMEPANKFVAEQMANVANQAFRTEFDRLGSDPQLGYGEDYKNMPKEWNDLFYDAISEMFKYDQDAMKLLHGQRDVKSVPKHYTAVRNRLESAFQARMKYEMSKAGGPGANSGAGSGGPGRGQNAGNGQGGGNQPPVTLDDLIEGNDRAVQAIPSMRR